MFSNRVIGSTRFLKMPISSQALYFHLGMKADDDGIVEAYPVVRMTGCSEDDLRVLHSKGFVRILNEDFVTFITDWSEHNKIRADRKIDSIYKGLLVQMVPENPECQANVRQVTDKCQSNDNQMSAQVRLGKDSIDKDNNKTYGDFNPKDADGFYPPKEDVDGFFNEIWKLYPRKEGKGKVSKTKKKVLYQIGKDQMVKCIERYKMFIKEKGYEDKFIMHGSTFFNSGYVDYLDENYTSSDANDNQISMFSDSEEWQ